MGQKFAALLTFILLAGATVPAVVFAQQSGDAARDPDLGQGWQQRVAQRKNELKTKLDAVTQARITARCKAAQTVLKNMQQRGQTGLSQRVGKYDTVSNKLSNLVEKLEGTQTDSTALKQVQAKFSAAVTTFKKDLAAYNQSLDDALAMDCAADPAGFKATLDSLRAQRAQLAKDAAAIKKLQPELVKALASVRKALVDKNQSAGEGAN